MTRPRISIALAAFEGARFLPAQLESFARQARLPDELVVCDDASGDETVAVVERFAREAPFPVRIERNATNLATTPNFEKAIGLCTGDLVFLSDQDDVWSPRKLAAVEAAFADRPGLGAVFCNGRVCDAGGKPLGYSLWQALGFTPAEQRRVAAGRPLDVFVRHVVAAGHALAFDARLREVILPFPRLRDCADAWIAFLTAAVAGIHALDEPLVDYRLHGANQFGLKRHSLREQVAMARWQLATRVFAHGEQLFTSIEERLRALPPGVSVRDPGTLALVRAKRDHCRTRDRMSGRLLERLPAIARETASGRYWRFSYGARSLAQDLLLR